ncbi:hypothetical protein B0H16DRAFT_879948 [Mycena metata]|uniref:Uncharacterized protein n=1 Tax=Mycena metata TaxID=1033252 RepID=A0AAD7K4U1_9AGAR|nr:hypothetical protein B0H16DRAFT_879948 [Mycena metata]
MASMLQPTASSTSSSPPPSTPPARRTAPSDVFRPRLPLDPFSPQPLHTQNAHNHKPIDPDAPWPAHDLQALSHAYSLAPHVLLVLGAPSPHALAPLLRSQTFARSLILLVTHNPPSLSAFQAAARAPNNTAHPTPAIRVLRLRAPLAPAAPAFALTLVSILDAAAAVARAWRIAPAPIFPPPTPDASLDIAQLAQSPHSDAFDVPEPLALDAVPVPSKALPGSEHLHPAGAGKRGSSLLSSAPPDPNARRRSTLGKPTPASGSAPAPKSSFPAPDTQTQTPSRPASPASLASVNSYTSQSSASKRNSTSSLSTKRNSKRDSNGGKHKIGAGGSGASRDGTRPFDALVSFLPSPHAYHQHASSSASASHAQGQASSSHAQGQAGGGGAVAGQGAGEGNEKGVLKQVVLVSTLASGFLAGPSYAALHPEVDGWQLVGAGGGGGSGGSGRSTPVNGGASGIGGNGGFDWSSAPPSPSHAHPPSSSGFLASSASSAYSYSGAQPPLSSASSAYSYSYSAETSRPGLGPFLVKYLKLYLYTRLPLGFVNVYPYK